MSKTFDKEKKVSDEKQLVLKMICHEGDMDKADIQQHRQYVYKDLTGFFVYHMGKKLNVSKIDDESYAGVIIEPRHHPRHDVLKKLKEDLHRAKKEV